MNDRSWLTVREGDAPLVVSLPHAGTDLASIEPRLTSPWLARKDADWWIDRLYDFAAELGATVVQTAISRTVIDVNRDPSGASLYPGMTTTELCPTTTFDDETLYQSGDEPAAAEIAGRRRDYFDPYHATLRREIDRLRARHPRVVLYDCHSIRSIVPRLFDGTLPTFNLGTNDGRSCNPELTTLIETTVARGTGYQPVLAAADDGLVAHTTQTLTTNGRFKGGYITRHYGDPSDGVHAIQMELAMRGYLPEPIGSVDESNWPPSYDADFAAPMRDVLSRVLHACLAFAREGQ